MSGLWQNKSVKFRSMMNPVLGLIFFTVMARAVWGCWL